MTFSPARRAGDVSWAAGALVVLAPLTVLALRSPLTVILLLATIVGVPLAIRRPEVILSLLALSLPAGSTTPELRIDTVVGQVTPFQIGVFITAGLQLAVSPSRFARGMRSPLGALGAVLSVTSLISAAASSNNTALYWAVNMGGLLLALAGILSERYREDPHAVTRWVLIAASMNVAALVYEYVVQRQVNWIPGILPPRDAIQFRPDGLTGNALVASAAAAVALSIALTSRHGARTRLTAAALLGAGALLGLSRTAMIAAGVAGAGYVLFHRTNHRGKWVVAWAGIPAAIYLAASQLGRLANRLGGMSFNNTSDGIRLRNLQAAWAFYAEHPIVGAGLGGFKAASSSEYGSRTYLATADNMFLSLLVDLGTLGAVSLVLCAAIAWHGSRGSHGCTLIPLLTLATASLFFDSLYHEPLLFLAAIAVLAASGGLSREDPDGAAQPSRAKQSKTVNPVHYSGGTRPQQTNRHRSNGDSSAG